MGCDDAEEYAFSAFKICALFGLFDKKCYLCNLEAYCFALRVGFVCVPMCCVRIGFVGKCGLEVEWRCCISEKG